MWRIYKKFGNLITAIILVGLTLYLEFKVINYNGLLYSVEDNKIEVVNKSDQGVSKLELKLKVNFRLDSVWKVSSNYNINYDIVNLDSILFISAEQLLINESIIIGFQGCCSSSRREITSFSGSTTISKYNGFAVFLRENMSLALIFTAILLLFIFPFLVILVEWIGLKAMEIRKRAARSRLNDDSFEQVVEDYDHLDDAIDKS